jgi:DNA-binding GntR family transcriptional regulator
VGRQRDDVIARLREKLLGGEIRPGVTFSENELADEFGTSRTPVREAVAILAHEGLLQQIPQVGVVLRELTPAEVEELVRVRIAVERLVAGAMCERRPADGLRRMGELLESMHRAAARGDKVAFLDADAEFHCCAAESIGYTLSAGMLRSIRDRIRIMGLGAIERDEHMRTVLEEHEAILVAIREGEPKLAAHAAEMHLMRTARRLGVELAGEP